MGIQSEMVDSWTRRTSEINPIVLLPSTAEERRIQNARDCTQEVVLAGVKAASIAAAVTAVPTLVSCRMIPWAKANLNYTAQALIISAGCKLLLQHTYFTADKTILECARRNTQYDKTT